MNPGDPTQVRQNVDHATRDQAQVGHSASFLASAVIFILTGYLTLRSLTADAFTTTVSGVVLVTVIINIFYFYYWIAFAELHEETRQHLKKLGHFEWILRIVNQAILFSLWLTLGLGHYVFFSISLPLVYLLYLIWDWITGTGTGKRDWILIALDIFGLVCSLAFLFFTYRCAVMGEDADSMFVFGMVCMLYLIMAFFGVLRGKFKYDFHPFSKKYWRASVIR